MPSLNDVDITGTDAYIDALCDWIDERRALNAIMPGYVNDPADVDQEGAFVADADQFPDSEEIEYFAKLIKEGMME